MFVALLGIAGVDLFTAFEAVLNERKQYSILVIAAVEKRTQCRGWSHRAESDGFSRSDLFQEP
jgi:hypothetical protein